MVCSLFYTVAKRVSNTRYGNGLSVDNSRSINKFFGGSQGGPDENSLIASAGYHLGIADSSIGLHGVLNRAVAFQALTQGAPWIIRCRLIERCVGTYLSLFCSCCSGSCLLSTPLFCGILLGGQTLGLLARFPLLARVLFSFALHLLLLYAFLLFALLCLFACQ